MSAPAYTPEEMEDKYICSFISLCGKRPILDCVRNIKSNQPYLYNSINEARTDKYFDPENDEVIETEEYYKRISFNKK